jgi:hypothetical protein
MNIKKLLITLFVFTAFVSYINGDKNIALAKSWPPVIQAFTINGNSTGITVAQGSTLNISWSSANTSSCSATGGAGTTWNGNSDVNVPFTRTITGSLTTTINSGTSQVFTLTCKNTLNIFVTKYVAVNVTPTPTPTAVVNTAPPTITETVTQTINTLFSNPFGTASPSAPQSTSVPPSYIPVLSSLNLTSGPVGTQVTITGTGFLSTGNVIRLNNTSSWISNLSSSGTSITFTIPGNYPDGSPVSSGNTLYLSVQNTNGTSNEKTFTVTTSTATNIVPTISTISPTSVPLGVGSKVTITGSGFPLTGNSVMLSRVSKWVSNLSSNGTSIAFTLPSYLPNGGSIRIGDILSLSVQNANGTSNEKTIKVTASSLPSVTTYTLLTNTAGTGGGTITGMKSTYSKNEVATLTAVPAVGSTFTGWSQDWGTECTSTTGACILVMSWNRVVTANFTKTIAPITYTLKTQTADTGAGTITGAKAVYTKGEIAVLTAVPAVGSTFTGWGLACTNTTGTCTIVMDANKTVTANFVKTGTPPIVVPPTYVDPFENSSSYVLAPTSWDHITPFAGFGVSTIIDSCNSYSNAMSDTEKIAGLLKAQATKQINDFIDASCPKTSYISSPTSPCMAKMYAIDNTLLSYAIYKAEGMKLKTDKAIECNPTTNKPTGADKKSWYNIDLVNLSFITVRDVFYAKRYSAVTTPVADQIFFDLDKLLNVRFINAVKYDKVIENTYVSADRTLRYYSINSFNLPRITLLKSTVGSLSAPTLSSNINPFYIFGISENELMSKEIGSIPFNSVSDYITAYNASPNRFSDLYSSENLPLLQAGDAVLGKLDVALTERIDNKMKAFGWDETNLITQTNEGSGQLANVLESIGNWFKGLWNGIVNFFTNLFGVKESEAASGTAPPLDGLVVDGTATSGGPTTATLGGPALPPTTIATPGGPAWVNPYPELCPELKDHAPLNVIFESSVYMDRSGLSRIYFANLLDTTKKEHDVIFNYTLSSQTVKQKKLNDWEEAFISQWDRYNPNEKQISGDYNKTLNEHTKDDHVRFSGEKNPCLSSFIIKNHSLKFLRYTSYSIKVDIIKTNILSTNDNIIQTAKAEIFPGFLLSFTMIRLSKEYDAKDSASHLKWYNTSKF